MQHSALANRLVASGAATTIGNGGQLIPSNSRNALLKSPASRREVSIDGVVSQLMAAGKGDYHFQRGLIDEFLRHAPIELLVHPRDVSQFYLEEARAVREEAARVIESYDALVLADSAYLRNRCLLSAARSQSKPAWIYSPKGEWVRVADSRDENSDDSALARVLQLRETPLAVRQAEKYFADRFAGKTGGDVDAPLVYGAHTGASSHFVEKKKVLFLHAVRDANQLSLRTGSNEALFPTYLQWIDTAFSVIANNPAEWWVKPHPQKFNFPDEPAIVAALLEKHNIPRSVLKPDLSNRAVFKNRLPVYTHSGTVALEAAAHGYRANVCSPSIPSQISNVALTLDQLKTHYEGPTVLDASHELSPENIQLARILLWRKFDRPARVVSPRSPLLDKSSKERFDRSVALQVLSLAARLTRPEARRYLDGRAAEIVRVASAGVSRSE